jgi:predicted lactoylglutathione lyase
MSPRPPAGPFIDTSKEARTMTTARSRKLFVNIPVRDLKKSMGFFTRLGFTFNKQFTDDSAACMVLSEDGYVMLIGEQRWGDFTKNKICDTRTHTEALLALSCDNRAEVDDLVRRAIDAGGRPAMDATDHGFMYGWSFYDLDGHHWEVFWMNPDHVQPPQ